MATPWRPIQDWIVWSLVVGGTLLVFWPILPDLWRVWLEDADNSHGVVVPLIAAALIWGRRCSVRDLPVSPSLWGFVLAGFALALYLASLRVHLDLPGRIALVLAIVGFVWCNFGSTRLRVLAFPLAFLSFMVPIPDTFSGMVAFPLQRFTSVVSAYLLAFTGIPVLREGNMLYFSNGALEVQEACSGVRSMASYIILGVLFAYLRRDQFSVLRRFLLIAATVPLALAINILRVAGTGVLATYIGSRAAQGFLHEFSGFVVFAFGFVLLCGLSMLLSRFRPSISSARPRRPLKQSAHVMVPPAALALTLVFLLTAGAGAWVIRHEGTYTVTENRLQDFPQQILEYQGRDEHFEDSVYAVLGNDYNLVRRYSNVSGRTVHLYIGYYGTAKGGRPNHVPQYCYTGQGFSIEDWRLVPAPSGRYKTRIHRMIVKRYQERQLVLYWFHSHGDRILADGLDQNLFRLQNRIVGGRDDGSLIRLSMPIAPDGDAKAVQELSRFAAEVMTLLPAYWPNEVRLRT